MNAINALRTAFCIGSLVAPSNVILPDGVAHVPVVTAKPVDPANDERVARTQDVEESATFRPIRQARADAGHSMIRDHAVELEACRLRLSALVL